MRVYILVKQGFNFEFIHNAVYRNGCRSNHDYEKAAMMSRFELKLNIYHDNYQTLYNIIFQTRSESLIESQITYITFNFAGEKNS